MNIKINPALDASTKYGQLGSKHEKLSYLHPKMLIRVEETTQNKLFRDTDELTISSYEDTGQDGKNRHKVRPGLRTPAMSVFIERSYNTSSHLVVSSLESKNTLSLKSKNSIDFLDVHRYLDKSSQKNTGTLAKNHFSISPRSSRPSSFVKYSREAARRSQEVANKGKGVFEGMYRNACNLINETDLLEWLSVISEEGGDTDTPHNADNLLEGRGGEIDVNLDMINLEGFDHSERLRLDPHEAGFCETHPSQRSNGRRSQKSGEGLQPGDRVLKFEKMKKRVKKVEKKVEKNAKKHKKPIFRKSTKIESGKNIQIKGKGEDEKGPRRVERSRRQTEAPGKGQKEVVKKTFEGRRKRYRRSITIEHFNADQIKQMEKIKKKGGNRKRMHRSGHKKQPVVLKSILKKSRFSGGVGINALAARLEPPVSGRNGSNNEPSQLGSAKSKKNVTFNKKKTVFKYRKHMRRSRSVRKIGQFWS